MENEQTQTKTLQSKDDIEEILDDARNILKPLVKLLVSHFYETGLKSTCQVNIEISTNKDEEVVVRYVPKKNLPEETRERTGEFSDDGTFHII